MIRNPDKVDLSAMFERTQRLLDMGFIESEVLHLMKQVAFEKLAPMTKRKNGRYEVQVRKDGVISAFRGHIRYLNIIAEFRQWQYFKQKQLLTELDKGE